MAIIVQTEDTKFAIQLSQFAQKIGIYAPTLGLTPADVAAAQADADYMGYCIYNLPIIKSYTQNVTNYKDLLRYGKGSEVAGPFPTQPVLDPAPIAVAANIENRFRLLIQRITHSPAYTTAMGEDLGIEAPVTPFNPQDGKPTFSISLSSGGHPNIKWVKGKFQGVEIWKDSGNGWQRLDKDFSPDFIDKSPLPAVGQSAVWMYKMVYLYKDDIVGSYSDEVSVTVTGQV